MMSGDSDRYTFWARILHWLMAVGFVFMWCFGYTMTSLVGDDSSLQELLFGLHISTGVTLLGLLVLRIFVRLANTVPPPPEGLASWEKVGSQLGHLTLYVLPAATIVVGWAETDFGGHGVKWFGVAMPKAFPTMETLWGLNLEETTATLHRWFAYTMLVMVLIHVVAVAKHRLIDGHDVLYRMIFSGRSTRE